MLTILIGIYSPFKSWNIPDRHVARLRREFPAQTFLHATSDAQALEMIGAADVAFMYEVRPAHLAAARALRWIHSPAAGVGGMLFPEMVAAHAVMTNSRGLSADTIAEHVIGVTLALFRKLPLAFASQTARRWAQDAMMLPPAIRMISGSRVLIVGLGSIGTAAARRFAALGAQVRGVRRRAHGAPPEGVDAVVPAGALMDELGSSDVVVLSAPQTGETHGLIGAAELEAMLPHAVLVNVSRGRLVDERALAAALAKGHPGAAALDVFEQEPLAADSPLWSLPNVLVTPHTSGFRPDHWDVVTDLFAANLRRFITGEPLLNVVDKEAGY